MAELCSYLTFRKQGLNPDEYCDAECMPGSDRCEKHQFDSGPHK